MLSFTVTLINIEILLLWSRRNQYCSDFISANLKADMEWQLETRNTFRSRSLRQKVSKKRVWKLNHHRKVKRKARRPCNCTFYPRPSLALALNIYLDLVHNRHLRLRRVYFQCQFNKDCWHLQIFPRIVAKEQVFKPETFFNRHGNLSTKTESFSSSWQVVSIVYEYDVKYVVRDRYSLSPRP